MAADLASPPQSKTVFDPVTKAEHYNQYSVEVIDLIKSMGFLAGSIVKYVARAPFKGHALQDYEKARFYLDMLIEEEKARLGVSSDTSR